MRMTLKYLAVAILCVGVAGATGFTNGSFSCNGDPDSNPADCGFNVSVVAWQYLAPGSTAILGWTVGDSGINWVTEYDLTTGRGWETTVSGDSAHYSIGLQGYNGTEYEAGFISQTFDTVSGTSYVLDYLYSMAPAAAASKAFVQASVRAEGLPAQLITYTLADHPTYAGGSNLQWVMGTYMWTAIGTTTTISFQSLETGTGDSLNKNGGIILDGLNFREDTGVPEPGTMSMIFGAGLFGLAWLVRRKR